MIELYTLSSISPNIHKPLIMLEESGLSYTVKPLDKHSGAAAPDDLRAISPNGTVPAIVDLDNGCTVFESAAILIYLAEKSGRFLPTEIGARSEVVQWLLFEAANVGPVMGELYHYILYAEDEVSVAVLQRYKDRLEKYCAILDERLNVRDYLCDEYSIADMALYPWTVVLEDIGEIDPGAYPNLSTWARRIGERAAVKANTGSGTHGTRAVPSTVS